MVFLIYWGLSIFISGSLDDCLNQLHAQAHTGEDIPTYDPYHPDNMLCYIRDGRQYIASLHENDPQNPYRRADLIYKIKDLIDSIQGIKRLRDMTRGFVWNEWRRYYVEARTPESYAQDKYFQDGGPLAGSRGAPIYDNVDSYTTRELIRTLKELKQFWDYM